MTDIRLYPTETVYALGVNALDPKAITALRRLKGRSNEKTASWLVRSVDDIADYAEVSDLARKIADAFLPGPLTLILPALDTVSSDVTASDRTIGFRISRDPIAHDLIADYMEIERAPLTCTSANVSGAPTLPTPDEILQQFGKHAEKITHVIDDGVRKSLASTMVRVVKDEVTVLREGSISEHDIRNTLATHT